MANNFVYSQPVKIFFGEGKFSSLGDILAELGLHRCVIACGRHFAPQAEKMREENSAIVGVFGGVEQNPQLSGIIETVKICRETNADAVIGIGGGSSLDTAKFAAAISLGDGEAEEYYRGTRPFPDKRLAIIAVPTTAGTGSEVTQVSVVSHGTEKKTINNPVFMWSRNHQPISDLMAIEAVRIILANLEKAYRDGTDMEARANMAYAALLGGLSFALPKTAASHACSYPLSEDYHLPHGEACAFTLDSLVRINADERLEYLCRAVGLSGTDELADRIAALKALGGLRTRLSDLGEVDLDKLCRDCAAHPLMNNNPVRLDEDALRRMFEALR